MPPLMRCHCDLKDRMKIRQLMTNGKIKANRLKTRATRDRKRALLRMKIKELHKARKDYDEPADLEEIDALILNLQQEFNEL